MTIFPMVFANEELRLLTAIVIGGAFGFALERGGFGNARKLAAQFYLNDMTVLKVMFTAIVTAMTGIYVLAGLGLVDLGLVWIPETFLWAQIVGGFLLGLGFIMSGLCPGTSLVSAASGRLDAVVAIAGIFIGTWLFGAAIDWFPGLQALFTAGALGTSTLPQLLGVPAWVVVILVIAMAGGAFMLAEKVEPAFQKTHGLVALTPPTRPPYKFALASALLLVVVIGTAARPGPAAPGRIAAQPIAPLTLAERLLARDPLLVVMDLRGTNAAKPIPGAVLVAPDSLVPGALADAVPGRTTVVIYDDSGRVRDVSGAWPAGLEYRFLDGGRAGWQREVLTPMALTGVSLAERERAERQHQIAAFFSGATVKATPAVPPPAAGAAGVKKKKPAGGC